MYIISYSNKWHEVNYLKKQRRIDKCLEFLQTVATKDFIPPFFTNKILRPKQLIDYLTNFNIQLTLVEAQDLISRLGGTEQLSFEKFNDNLLPLGYSLQEEAEITYVRLLDEERRLEKSADEQRLKILKRWDYNCEQLFKKLSNGTMNVDFLKFKKFFIRIRQPVVDEDIYLLIRRIGNCETQTMSYVEFTLAMKTQKQRVNERVDAPPMKISTTKLQYNYMDKLRMKYKPKKQEESKHNLTPRNMRSVTPQSTETKMKRSLTPMYQNTEPRKVYHCESKELNQLMSMYLNQQRCLQNVLSQLEDLRQLKRLCGDNWEQEWVHFGVNAMGVSYEKFINVLELYDSRRVEEYNTLAIKDLSDPLVIMADNLFDLIRDQDLQLQRAKLQFIREGSMKIFERYFVKGYMDVLDMLELIERSSSSAVSLQDAELLIMRFNGFDRNAKVILRKTLLNELT